EVELVDRLEPTRVDLGELLGAHDHVVSGHWTPPPGSIPSRRPPSGHGSTSSPPPDRPAGSIPIPSRRPPSWREPTVPAPDRPGPSGLGPAAAPGPAPGCRAWSGPPGARRRTRARLGAAG